MFLVHICSSRYARPFKNNNKHCRIFPFEDTKSAFAFAEWYLENLDPITIRVEKFEGDVEEVSPLAKANSDAILLSLEDGGKPDQDDIDDCGFVS